MKAPVPARRPQRRSSDDRDHVECPRCGRSQAKVVGRSETVPVVYLRCDGCHLMSVMGI